MKVIDTGIEGLIVIEPKVFKDERGYFYETFNEKSFSEIGIANEFVQDNESKSCKGVLRGLHFQTTNPQSKLVRCSVGVIWDVAVDLRPESATYKKWFGVELSAENKKMMYIPERFAHGFVVISDEAIFNYKCSNLYDAASDNGIMYDNEEINVEWPVDISDAIISQKDKEHTTKISDIVWS